MASNFTSKRGDLFVSDKRKICEIHKVHPSFNHEDFAQYMVGQRKFKLVDHTTISKILRAKVKWLNVYIDLRGGSVQCV